MRCPACRRDVPDSSRYCLACGALVDASRAPTLTAAEFDPSASSEPLDGAQFVSGTILAGRYRIVGLLGRGGMGEVYRAEDLKLGQIVALKFLPIDFTHHAERLARFHQEVRLARQVSHPNVCRVHDIGEASGHHFLSMEYIDGEDLASLLRRIGRLPSDKAIELAHQLCAGLAAAHARGVLHRDLKPANVLIDGRGRVHLVDFGLASLTDQKYDEHQIAGTPGYMAPEQRHGGNVTTRTDVYALGLVLYEMFTGRRALAVDGTPLGMAAIGAGPSRPSSHISDLDPSIDRVIMRCLEHDPARRLASAIAVAAALPGGDALAAAIAAGETPSPEMVAAAGESGTLSPNIGLLCFAGVLIGLVVLAYTAREVSLIGLTNIELTPQQLTERAHTVLRNLGYSPTAADEAIGYATDLGYLKFIDEHDRSGTRWRALGTAEPPAILFWYRQSPRPLVPIGGTNIVTQENPPMRSAMVSLTLDRKGRMVTFLAVPGQIDASSRIGDASAAEPSADWKTLFAEAGLSDRQFSAVSPQSIPPVFADTRAAWNGAYPERPNVPIRIEAAANQAKPVFFDIVAPWSAPRNEERQFGTTSGERTGLVMRMVVSPLLILVATILAVRNLRLGRGDRRGATRLSMFLFAAGAISNALETGNLLVLTTRAPVLVLFVPGFAWLLYIALEPHVRRVWPETMIAWSRLLAGGLRDPLVGRDVLVGVLLAIGNALVLALHTTLRRWSGRPPQFPTGADGNPFDGMAASSDLLLGGRYALSRIIGSVMSIPAWGTVMSTFLVLLVLYALLRRRWLAIAALTLGLTVIFVAVHGGWLLGNAPADHFAPSLVDVGVFAATQAAIVVVAVRFGLLTMLIASFVSTLLNLVPIAVDASAPYASSSWMIVATVIALAISGWRTALDGRPMFGALFRVE